MAPPRTRLLDYSTADTACPQRMRNGEKASRLVELQRVPKHPRSQPRH